MNYTRRFPSSTIISPIQHYNPNFYHQNRNTNCNIYTPKKKLYIQPSRKNVHLKQNFHITKMNKAANQPKKNIWKQLDFRFAHSSLSPQESILQ